MSAQWPIEHPRYQQQGEVVDKGSGGLISTALDLQSGKPVMLKLLERGNQVRMFAERGAFSHRILSHPHIVRLKEAFLTQRYLGIVMEHCTLGELYDYTAQRGRLTEDQARWFFQQLMIAVDHIHCNMNMAHRDIRLEHVMLTGSPNKPMLKLCTFGYAKALLSYDSTDFGTLDYVAPEVLLGAPMDPQKADVWSCAVALYVMLTGQYPYLWPSDRALSARERQSHRLQQVLGRGVALPAGVPISTGCRDLLEAMFQRDPAERWSCAAILAHPWFTKNLPQGVLNMNSKVKIDEDAEALVVRRIIEEGKRIPPERRSSGGKDEEEAQEQTTQQHSRKRPAQGDSAVVDLNTRTHPTRQAGVGEAGPVADVPPADAAVEGEVPASMCITQRQQIGPGMWTTFDVPVPVLTEAAMRVALECSRHIADQQEAKNGNTAR